MKDVFVYKKMIGTKEFELILAHEKTHIEQRHTYDLLLVQTLAIFLWFNPFIWLLLKSLKTTHEYIVDKKIIHQENCSLNEYQSLLLTQLITNNTPILVHNFNLSFTKKRITMMKKRESGKPGKLRTAFALVTVVVFSLFMVQCHSNIENEIFEEATQNLIIEEKLSNEAARILIEKIHSLNNEHVLFEIKDEKVLIEGDIIKVKEIVAKMKEEANAGGNVLYVEEIEINGNEVNIKLLKERINNMSKSEHMVIDIKEDAKKMSTEDKLYLEEVNNRVRVKVIHETPSTNQDN